MGKRKYTGKFIKPVDWNKKAQRARCATKESLDFNNDLILFGAKAISILSALIDARETDILQKFKEQIKLAGQTKKRKVSNELKGQNGTLISFMEEYASSAPNPGNP